MPYILGLAAAALLGAAVTYKTSDKAKQVLDSAVELAERIEKPVVVLGALATVYYFSRKR